jgi:hypothetical protein
MADPSTSSDLFSGSENVDWTRMWILKPDRSLGTILDEFVVADINVMFLGQGYATVKFHKSSRACALTYQGNTALEDDFENYGLNFYYRDPGNGTQKKFTGIAGPREKSWEGSEDSAFVTVTFVEMTREILRRHQVLEDYSVRYSYTDTPDNIARHLIARQWEAGSIVTPTGYPVTRTRIGPSTDPWTVTVENVKVTGDHPDSMTYDLDHGTNLNEAIVELCMGLVPSTNNPTELVVTCTETSPKTFHFAVVYGRGIVGARAYGTDNSDKVFCPERGTLSAFQKRVDPEARATVIGIRGRGPGTNEQYVHDATEYAKVGTIEDSWRAPEATSTAEQQWEAKLFLNQRKAGIVSYQGTIREAPNMRYGRDVNVGDKITLYSGEDSFDETVALDLLGVRIHIPAPGWPRIDFMLGTFERNPLQDRARHGGGGGRSGGGGRPRKKRADGDCPAYGKVWGDDNTYIEVEKCGDEAQHWGLKSSNPNQVVFDEVTATNTASITGSGTCDRHLHKILGIVDDQLRDTNCVVRMEVTNGQGAYVELLAYDPFLGP